MATNDQMEALRQQLIRSDFTPQMVNLLKAATSNVLSRAKQSMDALLEEESAPVVKNFETTLGDQLVNMSTEWMNEQGDALIIYPEGTRFVSKDDNQLNIIVEQKPQQRRIAFLDKHYFISLPFVQFVMTFQCQRGGDRFQNLAVSCSKLPIKKLEDFVVPLPLSNISGYRVCTGYTETGMEMPAGKDSIMDKVNTLISSYWVSQFNTDLNDNLIAFLTQNFGFNRQAVTDTNDFHRRLHEAFARWEERSKAEPMFMLTEQAKLNDGGRSAIGRLVPSNLTSRGGRQAFKNQFKTHVNAGLSQMSTNLVRALSQYNINEENTDQSHMAVLGECYRRAVGEALQRVTGIVFEDFNKEKREFETKTASTMRDLANRQNLVEQGEQKFNRDKTTWEQQKIKTQTELFALHQMLQNKANEFVSLQQQVQTLQQQLASRVPVVAPPVIGADGQPVKRGRGRPRKPVVVQLDANGNPIQRKRGRPRKNPAA